MTKLKLADLIQVRHKVKDEKPLIHAITNPISINDCANAVLAVGAKPIMAEHPGEVAGITKIAKALAVNLGNITDIRMESMLISGQTAREHSLPSVIDLVGIGCSKLRLDFANTFINKCQPSVIKGNMSELKALLCVENSAQGIDVGENDIITEANLLDNTNMLEALAAKTNAVVAATGVIDIITDGKNTYLIKNGCSMLSHITGTGCMLNVLTASFISTRNILAGTVLAASLLGICGEVSNTRKGTGAFRSKLLDSLYCLSDDVFKDKLNYTIL